MFDVQKVYYLARQGQFEQALILWLQAAEQQKLTPEYWQLGYQLYFASNQYAQALHSLEQLLTIVPDAQVTCIAKADLLLRLRFRGKAVKCLDMIKLAGLEAEHRHKIAELYLSCDRPEKALPLLETLSAEHPNTISLRYELALCQFYNNQMERAEQNLLHVLHHAPSNPYALHLRSTLRKQTIDRNNIESLLVDVNKRLVRSEADAAIWFALAKELEDTERYDESIYYLHAGAKIKRQFLNYQETTELDAMNAIVRGSQGFTFSNNAIAKPRRGKIPIFIVGLPRTGTTLLERILLQHSSVFSVGECPDFPIEFQDLVLHTYAKEKDSDLYQVAAGISFEQLRENYLNKIEVLLPDNTSHFIDKLPYNFLYCGYLKKAFPDARIVHLTRHPMDAIYAIYKTLFQKVYSFSYSLTELANYYISYHRLMQHWKALMPGQILDIAYEELVTDSAAQTARVLQWCQLECVDEMLGFSQHGGASTTASAAQIRQPIYQSSIGKWRKVADPALLEVEARLKQAGIQL